MKREKTRASSQASTSSLRPEAPERRILLILFGIAFAIRLLFLLESKGQAYRFLTRYTVDAWYFWTLAQQLVHGGPAGHEVFFMPPLYPFFLAACNLIFGNNRFMPEFIQILFGSGAAVLVYVLALRVFDRRVALVSFIAYLLCGNILFLDTVFLPNAFTNFGELLVLYLLLVGAERTRRAWRWDLIAGLILGLLSLIRAETLLFLPLLLLAALIWRNVVSLRGFGWVLLGSAIVIAPVFVRNAVVGKDPVLISYNGGLNLYLGNNPDADGTWQPKYPLVRTGSVTIETLKRNSLVRDSLVMKPSESSSYWTGKAVSFITSEPGRFLGLAARKLGLFATNFEIPNNYYFELARDRSLILKLAFLPFGLILALGIAGMLGRLIDCGLRKGELGFYLFFIVYLATGVVVFTVSRLRAPVVPLLTIFGSYFGIELYLRFRQHLRRNLILSGVALIILVVSLVPLVNRRAYAVEGLIQAGNIYLDQGQPANARDEYARAAKLDPGSVVATYGRFNSAAKLKNRTDAERYSAELYHVSRTPADSVYAFLSTALLGTMTNDFLKARDYYLKALEIDPQNFDTRYLLGLVYYTLKDLPDARAQVEIALNLNPDDQQALSLYAQLQRMLP